MSVGSERIGIGVSVGVESGSNCRSVFFVPSGSSEDDQSEEREERDLAQLAAVRRVLTATASISEQPYEIILLDRIPSNNGLPDRRVLREAIGRALPEDPLVALSAIWCETLRLENLGVNDSFLSAGGGSLAAMRVVNRVKQQFGVRLPLFILFTERSVREIADFIGSAILKSEVFGR